jgi:hypothetical protein
MEASSSSADGGAGAEADAPAGPAAAAAQQAAAEDEGQFAGMSDEAVALWLQQRLESGNPHLRKKFEVSGWVDGWVGGLGWWEAVAADV